MPIPAGPILLNNRAGLYGYSHRASQHRIANGREILANNKKYPWLSDDGYCRVGILLLLGGVNISLVGYFEDGIFKMVGHQS
jgi:hypothetical protein